MKRAVIFDLDGTLVDSEDFIVWSFVEAGRVVGVVVDGELVRSLLGRSLEDVVEVVFRGVERRVVEEVLTVRERFVRENWRRMVRVFPDVVPALRALASRGFLLAVASSSRVDRVVEFLEYFDLLRYFHVVAGVTPGIPGKPSPAVILQALRSLGVQPGEAVYVGDREVDCLASRGASVDFVLVSRGGRSRLENCEPVIVVKSLLELPEALSKLYIIGGK